MNRRSALRPGGRKVVRESTAERLEITSLALGGDAVAHVEHGGQRRAVFVPFGAPGDVIDATIDWSHHPARGVISSIVHESAVRKTPACAVTTTCGGCPWMHVDREARHDAMLKIVTSTILRNSSVVARFFGAPAELGYRTRARFALHGGRSFLLGYRASDGRRVNAIDSCVVLSPQLAPVVDVLRESLAGAIGDGEASVALGRDERPVIVLSWTGDLGAEVFRRFDAKVSSGAIAGVSIRLRDVAVPAVIGDPTIVITGADGLPLEVPPGGFAQANPEVAAALAKAVIATVPDASRVVELYAGSGFFSVQIARSASSYVAVENDLPAVAMARKNLAKRGLVDAKIIASDAAKFPIPRGIDVVVIDPPRTGCDAAVIQSIVDARVRRVVYVSCDVATLGRDLERLALAGYALQSLDVFDMMPGTSHVELVAVLERQKRATNEKKSA